MKKLMTGLFAGAMLAALPLKAAVADYPDRPIRIVVPFAPGGIADATARTIAAGLTERLKQSVVVDNRPGGAAIIGITAVANAPADGYTLLLGSTNISTNPSLYSQLPYDTERDLSPVSLVMLLPAALIVPSSFEVETFGELMQYARDNPGRINYSSVGLGSYPHLAIENLVQLTDTEMTHVPYKGFAPATLAVLSGEVQLLASDLPGALQHIRGGQVRALAVTGAERSAVLPDVPTVQEEGVDGYEVLGWLGIMAAGDTPLEIRELLNREINAIMQEPNVQERFASQGVDIPSLNVQEFQEFLTKRHGEWEQVIRTGGIKLD